MKILYGVQTTGNGHLVRARNMIPRLRRMGHEVHTLFSGDINKTIWNIELFEPYSLKKGLTFYTGNGKLYYFKTLKQLNFFQFYSDIFQFDASDFDLVITDYEPISARVAKHNKIPSIGIGHLYAFYYDVPLYKGGKTPSVFVMRNFAPADTAVGMHWHHFGQPILPPVIPPDVQANASSEQNYILVYLPFEDLEKIKNLLSNFEDMIFIIYAGIEAEYEQGNLKIRPLGRERFVNDLNECEGVICNAGFSLLSEALHLGKKILTKPVKAQVEQESNALALEKLGLGVVAHELNQQYVEDWLKKSSQEPQNYPDVARELTEWIDKGDWENPSELATKIWNQ